MEWQQIGENDQGFSGTPGSQYSIDRAIVEKNDAGRYRVRILDRGGSNQGYPEEHFNRDRQYRANTLDELMRISLAAERQRTEINEAICTAIREGIYAAEDAEAEQKGA